MFEFRESKIAGCFEIQPRVLEDTRGRFVKVFHRDVYAARGLETDFVEEFFSISHKNVIRGLHFQTPPMSHVKLVCCVQGEAMDVVLDLRVGSPTYGQFDIFELGAMKSNGIYIPEGLAHGFCALSESATMLYNVTNIYSPAHDSGIRYDSVGIPWPVQVSDVIISDRDIGFPSLKDFRSPFFYEMRDVR